MKFMPYRIPAVLHFRGGTTMYQTRANSGTVGKRDTRDMGEPVWNLT